MQVRADLNHVETHLEANMRDRFTVGGKRPDAACDRGHGRADPRPRRIGTRRG